MKTPLLKKLYDKYNINNLTFGVIHDKLGDVYEEFCTEILNSNEYLLKVKKGEISTLETEILYSILCCYNLTSIIRNISKIEATTRIPHRASGGNSKTDIIASIHLNDGQIIILPISCKQSTVPKVALAEFDVDTMCNEMGITDEELKRLLLKHQTDASAKNFTKDEKNILKNLLSPNARNFVRWVLTGSPHPNYDNVCIPTSLIKFKLKKPQDRNNICVDSGDFDYLSFTILSIEEAIDNIMLTKNGNVRSGGFGTGLSWTYATGSKGTKIQFKG